MSSLTGYAIQVGQVIPPPPGYTALNYLESTGTQWIDTGIFVSKTLNITASLKYNYNSTGNYHGMILAGYQGWFAFGNYNTNYLEIAVGGPNNRQWVSIPYDTNWHTYHIENGLQYIDSTQSNYELELNNNNLTLWLFKAHVNFSSPNIGKSFMRFCTIYQDEVLIRSFIPCLDPNNRPCMYDLVSKTPFYNQGSGEFLYG